MEVIAACCWGYHAQPLIQAAYAIPSGAVLDGNRIQNAVEGSDRTTSIFAAEMSVELRAEWNAILGYTRLPHMDQGGRADAMLTSDVVASGARPPWMCWSSMMC